MKQYLIPQEGQFYKANMHTHTTCSDGKMTPEEVKDVYKTHGYSVVAFTDHDIMIDHSDLNDEDFLAITSYEVETNQQLPPGDARSKTAAYHLNFYAPRHDQKVYPCPNPNYTWGNARALVQDYYTGDYRRVYSVEGQNDMIAKANELGFMVSYNHPAWSLQSYPDYAGLEGLRAVEVYNSECNCIGYDLDASDHILQNMLRLGKRVFPVATDDTHSPESACRGWICLKAPSLTYDAIINSYRNGDFYASWGPVINSLWLEAGVLHVECQEVKEIYLCTDRRYARHRVAQETPVTQASFDLKSFFAEAHRGGDDGRAFVRLVLIDQDGNKAMTRGYFADELSIESRGLTE